MDIEEIVHFTGEIQQRYPLKRHEVIIADHGRFLLSARSSLLSHGSAIKSISHYGVGKVLSVGEKHILQEYVEFEQTALTHLQLINLMKKIHRDKKDGLTLVHGDFSRYNTTDHSGSSKCFDYEYSHWGSPYTDIARVVLRECESEKEAEVLLNLYFDGLPSLDELRQGFIIFCLRQYEMRKEKNQPFQDVPLMRAKRLEQKRDTLSEVLHDLRDQVKK